jgi:general stress protein 26
MNTTDTSRPDVQQLADLVSSERVAMLTVCMPDGSLASRPMTVLELDADGAFWFFCDADSLVLTSQPVNLAFSDESRATYVSVTGWADRLHDVARIHALWSPMAKPWFPKGPNDPQLALLRVRFERAEYWDAPDSRIVRGAALVTSMASGRPVGLGRHGVIDPAPMSFPRRAPPALSTAPTAPTTTTLPAPATSSTRRDSAAGGPGQLP